MRQIEEVLRLAIRRTATDLHVQAGLPPMLRVQTQLVPLAGEPLAADDARRLTFSLMSEPQRKIFYFQHRRSIVVQRGLGTDAISFASALRAVPRGDPDVVLVGEMRDFHTLEAALTAAETEHRVFATLRTKTPARSIDRIVEGFPPHPPQARRQLANVLHAVITQQLLMRKDGDGMVLAAETLGANAAVRNRLCEGKTYQIQSVLQTGTSSGMTTMEPSLEALVDRRGLVPAEDASGAPRFDARERSRLLGRR